MDAQRNLLLFIGYQIHVKENTPNSTVLIKMSVPFFQEITRRIFLQGFTISNRRLEINKRKRSKNLLL